jgi:hypothetical protein
LQSNNRSELIIGAPGVFDWKGENLSFFLQSNLTLIILGTIVRYRALDKDSEGSVTTYGTPSIPNPKTVEAIPYLGYFGAYIL